MSGCRAHSDSTWPFAEVKTSGALPAATAGERHVDHQLRGSRAIDDRDGQTADPR